MWGTSFSPFELNLARFKRGLKMVAEPVTHIKVISGASRHFPIFNTSPFMRQMKVRNGAISCLKI